MTEYEGASTPWARDDRAWFSAHPRRAHRVRAAFSGEHQGEPDFVIVRQIRPGLRIRKPFTLIACSADLAGTMQQLASRALDDSEGEGAAHALFDLPADRMVSPAEIMAIVTACESALGGDTMN